MEASHLYFLLLNYKKTFNQAAAHAKKTFFFILELLNQDLMSSLLKQVFRGCEEFNIQQLYQQGIEHLPFLKQLKSQHFKLIGPQITRNKCMIHKQILKALCQSTSCMHRSITLRTFRPSSWSILAKPRSFPAQEMFLLQFNLFLWSLGGFSRG